VRYEGAYVDHLTPQRPDLLKSISNLTEALRSARDFATRQQMETWPAWFERAAAGDPDIPYHPDMLPSGSPEAAAEYAAVSRNLYSAVLRAVLASVNCEIGPGPNDGAA
jgi:hypothetical protein